MDWNSKIPKSFVRDLLKVTNGLKADNSTWPEWVESRQQHMAGNWDHAFQEPKSKQKLQMGKVNPKLQAACSNRRIHEVEDDDKDYPQMIADARLKLKKIIPSQ